MVNIQWNKDTERKGTGEGDMRWKKKVRGEEVEREFFLE